jgi:hypothetical protein
MIAIEYPTITVGAHEDLVVRMSLASQILMRRRGIDVAKLGTLMLPKVGEDPNPDAVGNVVTVFSCMVAENFLDLAKPNRVDLSSVPTPDYWATQIDDLAAVERAVWAAVGKAVEERRKKLAAVPPMEASS